MSERILKGDTVAIIAGKNKGKRGKVSRVLREAERVSIEGINVVKRNMRPTPKNPQGGVVEREAPIHISNVMLIDPSTDKPTRIKFKIDGDKKVRVAVKTGTEIPTPARAKKES